MTKISWHFCLSFQLLWIWKNSFVDISFTHMPCFSLSLTHSIFNFISDVFIIFSVCISSLSLTLSLCLLNEYVTHIQKTLTRNLLKQIRKLKAKNIINGKFSIKEKWEFFFEGVWVENIEFEGNFNGKITERKYWKRNLREGND